MGKALTKIQKAERNKALIIGGALIVGGITLYFGFDKLLTVLGLQQSKNEKKQEKEIDDSIDQGSQENKPASPDWYLSTSANAIYDDLRYSAVSDEKADAIRILKTMKNDGDILRVVQYFGKRQEYFFGIPVEGKKDLRQFVSSNLTIGEIQSINDNYKSKGMKFRF